MPRAALLRKINTSLVQSARSSSSTRSFLSNRATNMTVSPSVPSTPILDCKQGIIDIQPSSPSTGHRLQRPTYTIPSSLAVHLDLAATHLRSGHTVAFPTETVYGLGASSLNPSAVKRIYAIKNRPSDNPLIIHVSSLDMLSRLLPPTYALSRLYLALVEAFWPGPLTLLFPSPNPPPLPAPQTNAIRMPNHPLALALIHHSDLPLSAPSANSSGRPSPTKALHVYNDLRGADGLGCILDGGDCGVGVESTVVNGLAWREGGGGVVDILRPGGLGVEEVERVVREVDGEGCSTEILVHGKPWQRNAQASSSKLPIVQPDQPNGHVKSAVHILKKEQTALPSTPGMKYRHYSPRVPVFLLLPSNTFPKQPISDQDHSPGDVISSIASSLASPNNGRKGLSRPRLGILHYDGSPLSASLVSKPPLGVELVMMSLGPDSTSAAQRLFSGMLSLEGSQSVFPSASDAASTLSSTATPPGVGRSVDAILIEGCSDEGLGLAVMERVGKAVGGGGKVGELSIGEGLGDSGRFWVQV